MQFVRLKELLKDFTVFSLADIRMLDSAFHRRRLNEWQAKGYLIKICKGYYIFSDLTLAEGVLFEIANRIYAPSYVSFEMALAHYGLIPETVYGITSASSRKTYAFKTKIAVFSYRTVNTGLFFGYDLARYNDRKFFKIASPEKALLDYFYLNPSLKTDDDYASLRIDKETFSRIIDRNKLSDYLSRFNQKTLTKRFNGFVDFLSGNGRQ